MWKFSLSLPFSLLPVLTLAALLQGAGSDLLEALSTSYLVLQPEISPPEETQSTPETARSQLIWETEQLGVGR